MEHEILSKMDNTIRTIEYRVGVKGVAPRKDLSIKDYLPDTVELKFVRFGTEPWFLNDISLRGNRVLKSGQLGRETTETFYADLRLGEVTASFRMPAPQYLLDIIAELTPKDDD
jgi:hypothetical protein